MQKFFCALCLLMLAVVSSHAWDDVGHKITSFVAWQRMSPAARENVIRILRTAPEDSHLSAFYMQYGRNGKHLELVSDLAIKERRYDPTHADDTVSDEA